MTRLSPAAALALVLGAAVCAASAAGAQARRPVTLGVGGGATVATGELGDRTNAGWHAKAQLGFGLARLPVGLRAEVSYHDLPIDSGGLQSLLVEESGQPIADFTASGKAKVLAGVVDLVAAPRRALAARPYVVGGAGVYRLASDFTVCGLLPGVDDRTCFTDEQLRARSETKLGIGVGAGVRFAVGGAEASIEARLHNIFTDDQPTRLIPVGVAVTFGSRESGVGSRK